MNLLDEGIQLILLNSTSFSSMINFVSNIFVDLFNVQPLHSLEQETNMGLITLKLQCLIPQMVKFKKKKMVKRIRTKYMNGILIYYYYNSIE